MRGAECRVLWCLPVRARGLRLTACAYQANNALALPRGCGIFNGHGRQSLSFAVQDCSAVVRCHVVIVVFCIPRSHKGAQLQARRRGYMCPWRANVPRPAPASSARIFAPHQPVKSTHQRLCTAACTTPTAGAVAGGRLPSVLALSNPRYGGVLCEVSIHGWREAYASGSVLNRTHKGGSGGRGRAGCGEAHEGPG